MELSSSSGRPGGPARSCPTCGATRQTDPTCYRCKSDLSWLVEIEQRADALQNQASRCYARGWYRQAARLAQQAAGLQNRPEQLKLLASALLLAGDFPGACQAYLRVRHLAAAKSRPQN